MRLLPLDLFAPVFAPLSGVPCGVVDAGGNAGDRMIHAATRQLCDAFGVPWRTVNPLCDPVRNLGTEHLLIFGGGNMGTPYLGGRSIRTSALGTGLPCTLLPQSWMRPETSDRYERVFVRDRMSLEISGRGELAPDLALGWECQPPTAEPQDDKPWLRADDESIFRDRWPVRDPAVQAFTPAEYIALAATCERVVTDRLHFAIAGLIAGRPTTLLPNSYHKNRGLWETWLRDLGCEWAEHP